MAKQVKFGIIGIGNMGSCHVNFITAAPNTVLTAVCDINPEAFKRINPDILKGIQTFTDPHEFLAKADIEAVIISVPHYDHPDLAIEAMNHGIHVIVEKPIAVHKAEAERLIAESVKHPELVRSAMFCQRTIPLHIKIKNLIEAGEFGKITRINWIITDWFRTQYYYDSGDWRASWRGEGGGVLLNQCPHQLDLFQWFFGLPKMVHAHVKFGKYHDIEVEDEVNAYMEFENGCVANFIATTGEAPGTNRLEITTERGKVVLENGKLQFTRTEVPVSQFRQETKASFAMPATWDCTIPYEGQSKPMHQIIIENVADAILNGTKLIAPVEEGIRGLELGNAMLLSGWLDKAVELPLDPAVYAKLLAEHVATSRYHKKTVVPAATADDFAKSF